MEKATSFLVVYELIALPILGVILYIFLPLPWFWQIQIICYLLVGIVPVFLYLISKPSRPVSLEETPPKVKPSSKQDGRVSLDEIWFDAEVNYHKKEIRLIEVIVDNDIADKLEALQEKRTRFIDRVMTQRVYDVKVKLVDRRQVGDLNQLNIVLHRLPSRARKSNDKLDELRLEITQLNHMVEQGIDVLADDDFIEYTKFSLAMILHNPTEHSTTIIRVYLDIKQDDEWVSIESTTSPVMWDIPASKSEEKQRISFYSDLIKENKISCRIRLIHTLGEIQQEATSTLVDDFPGFQW